MSHTIERLTNPDAISVKLLESFDPTRDMLPYYEDYIALLDSETHPVTSIIDILDVTLNVGSLLQTTRDLQDMELNPAEHPMSKDMILISKNSMMRLSIDGFRKFGILKTVQVVETYDEAVAIVKKEHRNSA